MKKYILVLLITFSSFSQIYAQYPFQDSQLPTNERVEDLLGRLTIQEKISLMMNDSEPVERLGVPAYNWWNEALHGVARSGNATVFPQAIGMAATFDKEQLFRTFSIISDEARAKYQKASKEGNREIYYGLTFWTPNINIFRDPRWGRGMETYGEDPYLSGRLGVAAVKGLQGNDSKYYKTHACAKHFAVHSGPEWNRHSFDVTASNRDLWETYLPVFEELVKEANVQEVMCAYNRLEGSPCCGSDKLLVRILREKWNYQGLVVSDCWAVSDFYIKGRHESHPNSASAVSDAVITGTDLECGGSYKALSEALEQGMITEKQIDISLRRVLKGRFELGMFDPDSLVPWTSIPFEIVGGEEHGKQALRMAYESMTLLKNEKKTLPLSKDIKRIAVVGANADDSTMMWGNYNGFPTKTTTILEGIKSKLPMAEVIYERGSDLAGAYSLDCSDSIAIELYNMVEKVKDADVIIYVGGLSPRLEGEEMPVSVEGFKGGDRVSIDLPKIQQQVLSKLHSCGKPVVFVLCTGSAIALTNVEPYYDALLNGWYPGQAGGQAVADVLFGDYNPAGRLPVTFYKSIDQVPDFENYSMNGRTYRYMIEKPLYPFGYGLSYTSFLYGDATLSETAAKAGNFQNTIITFPIQNIGVMDGDVVPQVYVKRLDDPTAPIKALKGFERIHIKAGDTKMVSFTLDGKAFSYYDQAEDEVVVKSGRYKILYGNSSDESELKEVAFRMVP